MAMEFPQFVEPLIWPFGFVSIGNILLSHVATDLKAWRTGGFWNWILSGPDMLGLTVLSMKSAFVGALFCFPAFLLAGLLWIMKLRGGFGIVAVKVSAFATFLFSAATSVFFLIGLFKGTN